MESPVYLPDILNVADRIIEWKSIVSKDESDFTITVFVKNLSRCVVLSEVTSSKTKGVVRTLTPEEYETAYSLNSIEFILWDVVWPLLLTLRSRMRAEEQIRHQRYYIMEQPVDPSVQEFAGVGFLTPQQVKPHMLGHTKSFNFLLSRLNAQFHRCFVIADELQLYDKDDLAIIERLKCTPV